MRHLLLALPLAVFSVSPAPAHAAPITETFTMSTLGGVPGDGSYTVTFDPNMNYVNQSTGLTVNYFDGYSGSPSGGVGFSYTVFTGTGQGYFYIGGLLNGVEYTVPDTNDYSWAFDFDSLTSAALFGDFVVTVYIPVPHLTIFSSNYGIVTATPVTPAAATPEPSSLLLLGTGILGVFAAAYRRCFKLKQCVAV